MSMSVSSRSVFVALIVGTSGTALGPSARREATAAGAALAVFAGSGLLLLGVVGCAGCDFHSPVLLELTETEKAIAVTVAITTINSVADLFLLILGYLR
jgi:hypothetical protein